METLAAMLFREAPKQFFAVLTGENAPFYVDALDHLERRFSAGGEISRDEAIDVIAESLEKHPEFIAAREFALLNEKAGTVSEQAVLILRRLVDTGWLLEPPRPDWQRVLLFQPNGEILLAALRQIAHGEASKFTDKLQLACSQLLNPDAFQAQAFGDLEACLENVRQGLRELHQMESGIGRHTRKLIAATTLKENLQVLYDEFSKTIGHACYRELVRAQLPTRILRARRRLDEIAEDERVLQILQREFLRRVPSTDPPLAFVEVRNKLDELARLLDSVVPQADSLDKRAADFARRAFARVRYLQEVSTGQRERVQALFDHIDSEVSRVRLSEIPEHLWLPKLLVSEIGVLSGDSLRNPPLRRQAGEIEPVGDELTDDEKDAAWNEVEGNLRDTLNVLRANRFVQSLEGPPGTIYSVESLPLRNDDDIADLVACLLQASARDAEFSVETERVRMDTSSPKTHRAAGFFIEDLSLVKE